MVSTVEKKTEQINLKVTYPMRAQLVAVCKYEGVDMAELVRGWIREKLREYKKQKTTKELFENNEQS